MLLLKHRKKELLTTHYITGENKQTNKQTNKRIKPIFSNDTKQLPSRQASKKKKTVKRTTRPSHILSRKEEKKHFTVFPHTLPLSAPDTSFFFRAFSFFFLILACETSRLLLCVCVPLRQLVSTTWKFILCVTTVLVYIYIHTYIYIYLCLFK